jgi:hypothetical protein
MAKSSVFGRFMTALKHHWRGALPHVKPLSEVKRIPERRGSLAKSSSFDAGIIPETGQRVYLHFQTTWKEAGYFTINLVVVDHGRQISTMTVGSSQDLLLGRRLRHGAHRISNFLRLGRHDKWWHLCEVSDSSFGDEEHRQFMRDLTMRLREGNWTAANYDDEDMVIDAAVADVTRDVETALKSVGVAAAGGA